ncbi:hypothetical protein ACFOEY_10710 [Paracandidimonas soli]|uniref:hypothetical protein n=1 Tax=Paracandidimonas soli TaxID=1917182 RepID=UPI003619FD2B
MPSSATAGGYPPGRAPAAACSKAAAFAFFAAGRSCGLQESPVRLRTGCYQNG